MTRNRKPEEETISLYGILSLIGTSRFCNIFFLEDLPEKFKVINIVMPSTAKVVIGFPKKGCSAKLENYLFYWNGLPISNQQRKCILFASL